MYMYQFVLHVLRILECKKDLESLNCYIYVCIFHVAAYIKRLTAKDYKL